MYLLQKAGLCDGQAKVDVVSVTSRFLKADCIDLTKVAAIIDLAFLVSKAAKFMKLRMKSTSEAWRRDSPSRKFSSP